MRRGSAGKVDETSARRRSFRRWSIGHLAVAAAAILAFIANVAFLRSRDDATAVVVAARPIEAGQVVTAEDLGTTMLRAEGGTLATLLTSAEGLEGTVAARPLREGELVGSSDLLTSPAPDGLASMSVPVDTSRAAGGMIRAGDRVDVVDVDEEGVASYVVTDVPVLTVSDSSGGALASVTEHHVVLGLETEQVLAVAEAMADGEVDIVVTTGTSDG
ncbi:MAG: RcpC/CpaB family pilus assembly protein [Actinomycetota bacterium]